MIDETKEITEKDGDMESYQQEVNLTCPKCHEGVGVTIVIKIIKEPNKEIENKQTRVDKYV